MIEKILQWFARIGAAFSKPNKPLPPSAPAPDVAAGTALADAKPDRGTRAGKADRAPAAPPAPVAPVARAADRPTAARMAAEETIDHGAEESVKADTQASRQDGAQAGPAVAPEGHEIKRRRELVRTLFNDFWSGRDDKPAAFVDRLDEAETYLNERLSASGEIWRLDAGTRKMLGLPPRHSRGEGSGAAHR